MSRRAASPATVEADGSYTLTERRLAILGLDNVTVRQDPEEQQQHKGARRSRSKSEWADG